MAKDGTNRGGARAGAGRKKKALTDKISEGKTDKVTVLPTANLKGMEMPAPKEYIKAPQKNGQENYAVEIYEKTWNWLNEKGCAELVSPELIEHYAMTVSRWIQCQDAISNYGFLAKHPTTGGGYRFALCEHQLAVHEAGQPAVVSDLPGCEGKLLGRLQRSQSTE